MGLLLALLVGAGYVSPILPGSGSAGTGFSGTCATTGNVSAAVPAGIANNDILLLWACSRETGTNAHSITVASGWAAVTYSGGGSINTFNTTTQCSLWWKRTTGTEASNPTVSRSTTTTAICASVTAWRGATTSGNPWETSSSAFSTATATPLTTSAITSSTDAGVTVHFFGSGITTNVAPTWTTLSGSASRGLGSSDAPAIVNGGTSTNRAGIGGGYDVQATHGSTGTASITFGGGTGTRCGVLIQLVPQSGFNPAVWQPMARAPNGKDIGGIDVTSHALLVYDQNPSGSGDILGVFRTNAGASDTWYVIVSTDAGVTWSYLTATSGVAPSLSPSPRYQSICQDTVSYKIHMMFSDYNAATLTYHRIALTYTSSHVTGFTWDAADVAGPTIDNSGNASDFASHVDLKEILDGNSTHILAAVWIDQPTVTGLIARLNVSRTTGLAPTGNTDWKKLTDSTTAGNDVILRRFTTAGSDGGTLPRDVFNRLAIDEESHDADCTFAQIVSNGSLHMFIGSMFYNDTDIVVSNIERFRFTVSAANWSLDGTANGTIVAASTNVQAQPCIGNAFGTNNYVWFTYGAPNGLHVSKVDSSGSWTTDAFTSPDTNTGTGTVGQLWWNSAVTVRQDEQIAYLAWSRSDINQINHYYVAYYDSSWHTTDISIPVNMPNHSFGYQPSMWSYVYGMPNSIGVITYPYQEWATGTHHYYTMIYTGVIPPAGAVPPGIQMRMRSGFGR